MSGSTDPFMIINFTDTKLHFTTDYLAVDYLLSQKILKYPVGYPTGAKPWEITCKASFVINKIKLCKDQDPNSKIV